MSITPVELVGHLFDRPSSHSSPDDVESKSVTLLRIAGAESRSTSDLVAASPFSRSTVYRVIDPCLQAGWLKKSDNKLVLTGGGVVLLRVLDSHSDWSEILRYVTDSPYRVPILDVLGRKPAYQSELPELIAECEPIDARVSVPAESLKKISHSNPRVQSRRPAENSSQVTTPAASTVHRTLATFSEQGIIERTPRGRYQLTPDGRSVLEAYNHLLMTVVRLLSKADFFEWVDEAVAEIPVDLLDSADYIVATQANPHAITDRLREISEPPIDSLRGFKSYVSPVVAEFTKPIIESGAHVEALMQGDTLFNLHHDPGFRKYLAQQSATDYLKGGLAGHDFQMRVTEHPLPFDLGIYNDERAVLTAPPGNTEMGDSLGMIESTDDELVEWALTIFDDEWNQSRPPLRSLVGRAKRRLVGN